jgi:predicted permease
MSTWHRELTERLESLTLSPERELEIIEELSQHLDDHVRELVAGGAMMDDARTTALADLDAPGVLAGRLQEILGRRPLRLPPPGAPARGRWLRARWHDLRYSLRALRRSPAHTTTVILTLGLTIGPTTALLSVGNWLLWRDAPGVVAPDRLALTRFETPAGQSVTIRPMSYLNLDDIRRSSKTLSAIEGMFETSVDLAVPSLAPEEVQAGVVTGGFFDMLGIHATVGRTFQREDDQLPAGRQLVVVSDGLARRAFGSPAEALAKTVLIFGQPVTVVGVLPKGFTGVGPFSRVSVWLPGADWDYVNHANQPQPVTRNEGYFTSFVVRLAAGATFDTAKAELDVFVKALVQQHPEDNKNLARAHANVTAGIGFRPERRRSFATLITTLTAVGAVLLLLGCANVTNLMLARGIRDQRERAVRLALGASRGRLAILQLTESVVLATGGALAGVALAFVVKEFVAALVYPPVSMWPEFNVPLDLRVLAITLGVSIGCGVVAGLAPALAGIRTRTVDISGATAGRTVVWRHRLRGSLAVAQLALSLALVTGAFLLVATLRNLLAIDVGFDITGVSVHRLDSSRQGYTPERTLAYYRAVFGRLQETPGMTASLSATAWGSNRRIRIQDSANATGALVAVMANAVTPSFFDVLSIRLIGGRAFTNEEALADPSASPALVIVNETLARRLFGANNPIGQRVVIPPVAKDPAHELTVIGVVRDARWTLTGDPPLEMYLPLMHPAYSLDSAALLIKSADTTQAVTERAKMAAMAIDPALPIKQSVPFSAELKYRLSERTTFAWVLSALGWLGLLLAAVGLTGLLAQAVAERTKEFGIRMAIGSGRAAIFRLVMRQAAWIGGLGTVIGLGLAAFGSRFIASQLYGVAPTSGPVYGLAAFVLVTTVFLAGLWPARTATRIQPVDALRTE